MSDDLSKVVFGDAIKMTGKRPAWLEDGIPMRWSAGGNPYLDVKSHECVNWGQAYPVSVRLPVDHPHYRQAAVPAQVDMGNPITDPIAKRMEALVRRVAEARDRMPITGEAQAIVALLDGPVNADEQYARDLIRDHGWSDMGNIGIEAVTIMIAKAHREGRALERDSREG